MAHRPVLPRGTQLVLEFPTGIVQRPTGIAPMLKPSSGIEKVGSPPIGIVVRPALAFGRAPPSGTEPIAVAPAGIGSSRGPPSGTEPIAVAPAGIGSSRAPPSSTETIAVAPAGIGSGQGPPTGTEPIAVPPDCIGSSRGPPSGIEPIVVPPAGVGTGGSRGAPTGTELIAVPPAGIDWPVRSSAVRPLRRSCSSRFVRLGISPAWRWRDMAW